MVNDINKSKLLVDKQSMLEIFVKMPVINMEIFNNDRFCLCSMEVRQGHHDFLKLEISPLSTESFTSSFVWHTDILLN